MALGNTLNILRPPEHATPVVQTKWNEDLVKNLHNVMGRMSQQITAGTSGASTSSTRFGTKALLEAATIPLVVLSINVTGYLADGDEGGAFYVRVGSEPSHTLKIQSADGAWWELVPDAGGINVHQAGAVGDGVADDTQAIQDCIDFLGLDNGIVRFLNKTYKITNDIVVEHTIMLQGVGHRLSTSLYDSTVISVASGKTGFMVRRGSTSHGDKSMFRNMTILAAGKNATATTGTMTGGSKTLTLAAASDFADGDLILLRGAGEDQTLMNSAYLTGATTAASPTLTLSKLAGIYDGMVLEVAGASFPAGTFVSSRAGLVVTMSANAANTVSAGVITYFNDLCVEIMSGGGSTTLTVNEAADRSVTAAVVQHYDCGIYSQSRLNVENVAIIDFQGAGLFIHAGSDVDSVAAVATNANSWFASGGRFSGCGNGLRLKGNDVNIGAAFGVDVGANTEYGLVDASFLGNSFFGCHVAGGFGYMVVFGNAFTVFDGCYAEGGTINTFAQNTLVKGGIGMGGSVGNAAGGNVISSNSNKIVQSVTEFYPSWSDWGLLIGNGDSIFQIDASGVGGSSNISWKRSSVAAGGQDGLWGWMVDASTSKVGLLISDSDADVRVGTALLPRGIQLGRNLASLAKTSFREVIGGTAAPVDGAFIKGDRVLNHNPSAGDWAGWLCVSSGTPGTWKGYGVIES